MNKSIIIFAIALAMLGGISAVSAVEPIPGYIVPVDTNGDGLADDFNGDGISNYDDLKILYDNREWVADNYGEYSEYFDYNGDGSANMGDIGYAYNYVKDTRVYDPIPGYIVPATNSDGLATDFNGDGFSTTEDVQILYDNRYWIQENYVGELHRFDYNGDGTANIEDIRYAYQWSKGTLPTPTPSEPGCVIYLKPVWDSPMDEMTDKPCISTDWTAAGYIPGRGTLPFR